MRGTILPRLAITLGDPRGIGPEIVRAVLPMEGIEARVIGPDDLLGGLPDGVRTDGVGRWDGGTAGRDDLERAGALTGLAVEKAVQLWKNGEIDAIVTAPGDKRALNAAGYRVPGHTELLRDLTGAPRVAMMLASDKLRVVLATTHIPLSRVTQSLSIETITEAARITRDGLREWFGIAEPRIALCALNPHAGDSGRFGNEDVELLAPAAKAAGIAGPFPADTVFVRAMRGEFDAVIAPYHDVGMTAIKVASFGSAVNITLGLPFPRTSPDHGTALDIAGQNRADPSSMIAATLLCSSFALRARPSGGRPGYGDRPTDSRSAVRPSRAQ